MDVEESNEGAQEMKRSVNGEETKEKRWRLEKGWAATVKGTHPVSEVLLVV
jgi:hypothetical protein